MQQQWYPTNSLALPPPPTSLVDWLLAPGSFMQRLKQAGVQNAKVQVLSQRWEYPAVDERSLLNILPRQYALVREVLIASGKRKWMFARTVFPAATLTGREQLLARLKNRALGSMLFNHPRVTRSVFHLCHLNKSNPWRQKIAARTSVSATELWARRSLFFLPEKSLLLAEVFFPDLMEL